ncbi:TetR family transcriptional regulator [Rhodococcus erythropolis]|uniref:TetR family transcriptional regulator n=1 Tax=Rhodococcus erythropolis TaxID=1833 RepID=UPI0029490C2D|nr:TetR family transcriptional regulator [Rhodococcus erythropolis]MDV6209022.1 TetR family transcriptional regulator [Rhodococcus erythropolis]
MPASLDAKNAMIAVAERMFAEHGIHEVSMRDVATAAGQRNNSAVQYHFGGRDGLVLAVFRHRMDQINAARLTYLDDVDASGRTDLVRALVEAFLYPLADFMATVDGSNYARFIARISPSVDTQSAEFREVSEGINEVVGRLTRALPHLPRRFAVERIDLTFNMSVSALAIFEQRREDENPVVQADFDTTVDHLVDLAVGALTAPQSAHKRTRAKWVHASTDV